jgi:hypothetical protein
MPAGPGAERLWRGFRQCPTWGCVRLRERGQESTATRTSSNETRGNVILVPQVLLTRLPVLKAFRVI